MLRWLLRLHMPAGAALVLGACGPAPLTDTDVRAAYKPEPGPYDIRVEYRTELPFPELDKNLSMRVAFPEQPGSYPVIVFSHGNGCYQDLYTGMTDHWASWGYVVIQPVHMDSRETGFTMKGVNMDTMNTVISSRRADVRFILDSFDQLEAQVDGLAGKLDSDRLIIAGHSMGGGTAMTLAGVSMVDPRDGMVIRSDEDRFDALIVISDPSNNRMMPNQPWRLARVPTIIATGSEDFSTIGSRDGTKSKDAYYLPADAESPDEPRWYLDIDGVDHYLGGVICRDDAPGPRDQDGLIIMNGATTAFLQAYIEESAAALAFLDSGTIGSLTNDRATLGPR